ncbi:hypothetical protein [Chryseobacterium mulctrae]|uniref:hypothetical protein n=1 Tax=Chryseobacterium mulctrae TaxID=2576777 RepID=UPI00111697A6|nr:hypothetical protein [Chryseobacterium mulctrae]
MKTKLKIEPETLFLLHTVVLQQSQFSLTGRNSGKSMIIELFEILSKKCIAYSTNANGKKRDLELRFHLAEKLLELTKTKLSDRSLGIYENNKLEIFKNELHQKLI